MKFKSLFLCASLLMSLNLFAQSDLDTIFNPHQDSLYSVVACQGMFPELGIPVVVEVMESDESDYLYLRFTSRFEGEQVYGPEIAYPSVEEDNGTINLQSFVKDENGESMGEVILTVDLYDFERQVQEGEAIYGLITIRSYDENGRPDDILIDSSCVAVNE